MIRHVTGGYVIGTKDSTINDSYYGLVTVGNLIYLLSNNHVLTSYLNVNLATE